MESLAPALSGTPQNPDSESIWSPELGRECTVRIDTPFPLDRQSAYPVIYAQDGQHLFRNRFRGRSWRAGDTLYDLSATGQDVILVGVDNGGARRADEYSPFVDERFGGGNADSYLSFLTETLKPAVDASLPTRPGPEDTTILGSSLGGLFSLYALLERPDVFGGAAALSPSVSFADGALANYVSKKEPAGQVYVDAGTREFGSNSLEYVSRVRKLVQSLRDAGHSENSLQHYEALGARHSESDWGKRLPLALDHLLRPVQPTWSIPAPEALEQGSLVPVRSHSASTRTR